MAPGVCNHGYLPLSHLVRMHWTATKIGQYVAYSRGLMPTKLEFGNFFFNKSKGGMIFWKTDGDT